MTLWRALRAVLLRPFIVTTVVPVTLLLVTESAGMSWGLGGGLAWLLAILGVLSAAVGLILIVRTVALFATAGQGTLAPWDPPKNLVVRGPYRHVRNPMISGVIFVLLGETMALGSAPVAIWFGFFLLINFIFIPWYEEPRLVRRFGEDYVAYRREVPRWIPRLRPWQPHVGVDSP